MELESFSSCLAGNEIENGACMYAAHSKRSNCLLKNEDSPREEYSIFNMFLSFYAGFSIIIAAVSLFIELLHGSISLFDIHVYIYFYLLVMGIVILVVCLIYKHNMLQYEKHNNQTLQLSSKYGSIFINSYFRYGVVVFGLVALFSICLQSAAIFTATKKCMNTLSSSISVLQCIFVLLEIPLLYQNFRGFANMSNSLQKVAVMHLFCTNVSLWIHTLLWESSKEWQNALHVKHNSSLEWGQKDVDIIVHSIESDSKSANLTRRIPEHVVHITSNCWWQVPNRVTAQDDITSIQLCLESSFVGIVWTKAYEISYPFIIHFYFLAVMILYSTWKNILIFNMKLSVVCVKNMCNRSCESMKGLCSGCFIIISCIGIVIFHLIYQVIPDILSICSCIIYILATCSMLFCLSQMKSLLFKNVSKHQDFMIFINWYGVLFLFLYGGFNLLSGILSKEKYSFILSVEAFFMIFHAIVQYIYLVKISELHIQSNEFKAGRQTVMFLILCNVSLWIFEVVSLWNLTGFSIQFKLYGPVVWPIIKTAVLPFVVIYRFFSVIIILETWTLCQT